MHVVSTIVLERVDGPSARSHAYFQLVDLRAGIVVAWGNYDDELVHRDGRWRWHTKAVNFLWRAEDYTEKVAALARPDLGSPNPVGGLSVTAN